MARKAIFVIDGLDADVLAAAGLRPGQNIVAEATADGLLLRAARDDEVADAEHVSTADVSRILRRYPATIERLDH